jgi:hypothetical protein
MSDPQAFLLAMYKEQCDQARQHEIMRQQSTTLILTVSTTIATVAGVTLSATIKPLLDARVPWLVAFYALLGWLIVKLAQLGERLSLKHYERNKLHVERARQYRRRLTDLFQNADYSEVNKNADQEHKNKWAKDRLQPSIIEGRLHQYWIDIFTFVRYVGIALVVIPAVLAIVLTIIQILK